MDNNQGRAMPSKAEPVKVVGFHVEGTSPSPRSDNLHNVINTGTMSPVMIPPTFQVSGGVTSPTTSTPGSRRTSQDGGATTTAIAAATTEQQRTGEIITIHPSTSAPAAMEALEPAGHATTTASSPGRASSASPAMIDNPKQGRNQQQQQQQQQQQASKKKEMTKAERRALQEAQRAVKAAAKTSLQKISSSGSIPRQQSTTTGSLQASANTNTHHHQHHTTSTSTSSAPIELFAHLPQYRKVTVESVASNASTVPIECVRLGLEMAKGTVRGANARCAAILHLFASVIREFRTPSGRVFAREFASVLNSMVAFLVSCRPLSPAMGNVIKAVKAELGRIAANPMISDHDAKECLLSFVTNFSQEKVVFAKESLARQAASRIVHGDVILTYACSSTVEAVLLEAVKSGTKFSVVVVDSRPLLEGRSLLALLLQAGIPCEYVLINGMMTSALTNATKVMLGAGAIMSNGAVLSRVGTAAVAMAAHAARIPVMVCCETFKFHDRVQLDSITYNELGNPDFVLMNDDADDANARSGLLLLTSLNLEYDATPAEFVTVVVTELGMLPPTSVPVVLREYRTDDAAMGSVASSN